MRYMISYRIWNWMRWVCVWAVLCSQLSIFTLNVAAQEPTTEPTSLPTPTPAATWTPTPTLVDTPDPAATPTATSSNPDPNPAGRLVDFRVDDDKIEKGNCATFSWVVRGDTDRVEFDKLGDGKVPVLVSTMDSREECPDDNTEYELIVSWLDSNRTTRSIEIEVESGDTGGDGNNSGTATPGGTSVFVPVTPIPITGTPVSVGDGAVQQATYQGTSGGTVVTPVGALGSVRMLPETGYLGAPTQAENDVAAVQTRRESWPALAGGLGVLLGVALIGLVIVARVFGESEAPR